MKEAFHCERLILRKWREADLEPFASMNADDAVMEFMPKKLTRAQSDALASRIMAEMEESGFGLWAVERRQDNRFIGFVGLSRPTFTSHFTPCVEIGWRMDRAVWGQGYATEGAKAVLGIGFNDFNLNGITSFTVPGNLMSRRVMQKIGMLHDESDDFEHPDLPVGHPLRRHVLYRLTRDNWQKAGSRDG